MAMLTCKDCGKEISDNASCCPHCGAQTRFGVERRGSVLSGIALILLAIGILLVAWGGLEWLIDYVNYHDGNWRTDGYSYKSPLSEHEERVLTRFWGGIGLLVVSSSMMIGISYALKNANDAAYAEHQNQRKKDILLSNGGWTCSCGKTNEHYVGTCACGKTKHDAENEKRQQKAVDTQNAQEDIKKNPVQNSKETVEALKAYKELLDNGVISQADFDKKKKELLGL